MDEQKWWLGLDANKSIFNSAPNESRVETNVMSELHRQVSEQHFYNKQEIFRLGLFIASEEAEGIKF